MAIGDDLLRLARLALARRVVPPRVNPFTRSCLTRAEPRGSSAVRRASGSGADAAARGLGRAAGADRRPDAAPVAPRRQRALLATPHRRGAAARPAGAPRAVADGPRPPLAPAA